MSAFGVKPDKKLLYRHYGITWYPRQAIKRIRQFNAVMGHLGDRHIATTNYGLCRRFRARHHEQFARYVDRVTNVFGQYTTDILAMIEEGNRVSGKMRFHCYHQQEIFGVASSGRHVWWIGMPIFTLMGRRCATSTSSAIFTG